MCELNIDLFKRFKSEIRFLECEKQEEVQIVQHWENDICKTSIINNGHEAVRIREVILMKGDLPFGPDTGIYGEGYSMLSQYGGTLASPANIGGYSDEKHYKLPQTPGFKTVYGLLMLSAAQTKHVIFAFASCRRFVGEIRFGNNRFELVVDTEGLCLEQGQSWELEEIMVETGEDRNYLLSRLADHLQKNHPRLNSGKIPTGWCSWYCFGPDITEADIMNNLSSIKSKSLPMEYIQIDDGYQAYMGDWLIPGNKFNNMEALCRKIKEEGFEPAIWVAPFIAEEKSELFKQHPDWFVKDGSGKPLPSDRYSFGGWRHGPWYMLDGTHPDVRAYLKVIFKEMREKWGCRYFKLDASVWGALHGGYHYDKSSTRVEAYRMGMKAVIDGAGEDSFILGCNAPMWPSLGLVHGMRVTGDIKRTWDKFKLTAREYFYRSWQHEKLWINDPDCIVLENNNITIVDADGKRTKGLSSMTEDEFIFHATYIFASGGMILSGDDISRMSDKKLDVLRRLLLPAGTAASFDDTDFKVGRIYQEGNLYLCLFNWQDVPESFEVHLDGAFEIKDFWTDMGIGIINERLAVKEMRPHSAKLLICSRLK